MEPGVRPRRATDVLETHLQKPHFRCGRREYQHAAAEQDLAALLTDALDANTGPNPTDEVDPLARWLARHAGTLTDPVAPSRHGDASAAPPPRPRPTWALTRHST
ncbi:hypothetical protein GCM10010345_42410 [Streptomyces canarius]|uniref:Uncharacterized protein n=1 Tax=Streptomyces canarius TaxID=285453 RepID=A0ABQ3CQZ0_9ACTN|nr:hypothetical protein GCM10010345_42410 [Streptomyces canarius]